MMTLPRQKEDISVAYLGGIVQDLAGNSLKEVLVDDTADAGVTDRIRATLVWTGQARPSRVFIKTAFPGNPASEPAAQAKLYANEANFYRDIAPTLSQTVNLPRCLGIDLDVAEGQDGATARSLIVLEELSSDRGFRWIPLKEPSLSIRQAMATLRQTAALHRWRPHQTKEGSSSSNRSHGEWPAWVPDAGESRASGTFLPYFENAAAELQRLATSDGAESGVMTVMGSPVSPLLLKKKEEEAQREASVWVTIAQRLAAMNSATGQFCHGDLNSGNIAFQKRRGDSNGERDDDKDDEAESAVQAYLSDWQTCYLGNGLADVNWLLVGSLDTEQRRAHEQELLAFYQRHANDLPHGQADETTPKQLPQAYRAQSLFGMGCFAGL